jgi:integrase
MRAGEASAIKWENIDLERKIVTLNEPEKHGRPRIFNISDRLVKMLSTLKRRNEFIWGN